MPDTKRAFIRRGVRAVRFAAAVLLPALVVAQGPEITGVNPASDRPGNSGYLVIYGRDLAPAPSVTIGCAGISYALDYTSAVQLNVAYRIAPDAAPGPCAVTVTTANGASTSGSFAISSEKPPAPVIAGISPASAPQGGSGYIAIYGQHMVSGTPAASVSGGEVKLSVSYASSGQINVSYNVPANAAPGVKRLTVSTESGTSNAVEFVVTPPPAIASISPQAGMRGTVARISGSSFGSVRNDSAVTFHGAPAEVVEWSDSSVAVTVPRAATTGDVIVTVAGVASAGYSFAVSGPNIQTALSYSTSAASYNTPSGTMSTKVAIRGSGFGADQRTSSVTFGGVRAPSVHNHTFCDNECSWSDRVIQIQVPQGARTGDVVVTVDGLASNPVPFTVVPPTITDVSPTSAFYGETITVHGANFGADQFISGDAVNDDAVVFNGATGPSVHDRNNCNMDCEWGDQNIRIQVPVGATSGDLVVHVNGMASNPIPFRINSPIIERLSTAAALPGTNVTISGVNFGSSRGNSKVYFNNAAEAPVISWSDTQTEVTVPASAVTGDLMLLVNKHWSNPVKFTIAGTEPFISGVFPPAGPVGTSVVISGANFASSGTVLFDVIAGTPTSWSKTSIAVPAPDGAKTGDITVGTKHLTSNGVPFTVTAAPVIYEVSPASGPAGTLVRISGARFGAGTGTTTDPTKPVSTVFIGDKQAAVKAWTDAAIWVAIPNIATNAKAQVVVWDSASVSSATSPYAYVAVEAGDALPYVFAVTPASGKAGATGTLTITGGNLSGVTSLSFDRTGVTAGNITSNPDGTSITVQYTVATDTKDGVVYVRAVNAAGTGNAFQFTVGSVLPRLVQVGWADTNRQPLQRAKMFSSNGDLPIGGTVWSDPDGQGYAMQEDPAAFVAGTAASMAGVVMKSDSTLTRTATLSVKVVPEDFTFSPVTAKFSHGTATVAEMPMAKAFPAKIVNRTYEFQWSIDYGSGAVLFAKTNHKVYLVHDLVEPTDADAFLLTVPRLDYVTAVVGGLAATDAGADQIAAALATRLTEKPGIAAQCRALHGENIWETLDGILPQDPSGSGQVCSGLDCDSLSALLAVQWQQLGYAASALKQTVCK